MRRGAVQALLWNNKTCGLYAVLQQCCPCCLCRLRLAVGASSMWQCSAATYSTLFTCRLNLQHYCGTSRQVNIVLYVCNRLVWIEVVVTASGRACTEAVEQRNADSSSPALEQRNR
jgi:hypothetical protein